jgi:enoyl-CoA hydratase/carnithine racemase
MIDVSVTGRGARVVIRRAEEGNRFTAAMVVQLRDRLRELSGSVDVLTLGAEGRDFCLGRDRKEAKAGTPYDSFKLVTELNEAFAEFPGIVVSGVRGRAEGFGVGLVMRSDIAIASDGASFILDEVSHGIAPMFIMAAIVDHLSPKRIADLIFTGREVDAAEALQIGFVSRVVPDGEVQGTVDKTAEDLLSRDSDVLRACKRYLKEVRTIPAGGRLPYALVHQVRAAEAKK